MASGAKKRKAANKKMKKESQLMAYSSAHVNPSTSGEADLNQNDERDSVEGDMNSLANHDNLNGDESSHDCLESKGLIDDCSLVEEQKSISQMENKNHPVEGFTVGEQGVFQVDDEPEKKNEKMAMESIDGALKDESDETCENRLVAESTNHGSFAEDVQVGTLFQPVQISSWKRCCGLFELFTGSDSK